MTATTVQMTPIEIHFEKSPCGRCGGSGFFGPLSVKGGVCFHCNKAGHLLTRRGRTAFDAYMTGLMDALGVPVTDIEVGMRVLSEAHSEATIFGGAHSMKWRKVAEVRPHVQGGVTLVFEKKYRLASGRLVEMSQTFFNLDEDRAMVATDHTNADIDAVRRAVAAKYKGAWLEGEQAPERPVRKPRTPKPVAAAEAPKQVVKAEVKPLAANLYAGTCHKCGGHVEAKAGERLKLDGRWAVQHKAGECPAPAPAEEPQDAPQEPVEAPVAPEAPAGDDGTTRVVLTRSKLYPSFPRPGAAWQWTYDYAVNGGPAIGYGPGLASLRDMLRRKFGRTVRIVESWKAQAPAEKPQSAAKTHEETRMPENAPKAVQTPARVRKAQPAKTANAAGVSRALGRALEGTGIRRSQIEGYSVRQAASDVVEVRAHGGDAGEVLGVIADRLKARWDVERTTVQEGTQQSFSVPVLQVRPGTPVAAVQGDVAAEEDLRGLYALACPWDEPGAVRLPVLTAAEAWDMITRMRDEFGEAVVDRAAGVVRVHKGKAREAVYTLSPATAEQVELQRTDYARRAEHWQDQARRTGAERERLQGALEGVEGDEAIPLRSRLVTLQEQEGQALQAAGEARAKAAALDVSAPI